MALPVASRGPGIDREHREPGCNQRSDQQPLVGLDGDVNAGRLAVAVFGQQGQQLAKPCHVFGDPSASKYSGLLIDNGHILLFL
jgi:hypothetical protein